MYICLRRKAMNSFGVTDVGRRRKNNQDNFIIRQLGDNALFAVVCDGMGGAAGGAEASSLAAGIFSEELERTITPFITSKKKLSPQKAEHLLTCAVDMANEAVYTHARENESLSGMGTTLVAVLLIGSAIYAVNVGDSRMYLVSRGSLTQITHDHSYVQFLVDIGKLSEDEARKSSNRNIITRAVGTARETECDFFNVKAADSSMLILCSDGLSNMLTSDEILAAFDGMGEDDLSSICRELIDSANENGGADNITAVVISL